MVVLREWLAAAQIQQGAVFTRLDYAAGKKKARITAQSVNLAFKRVARMLNVPELGSARISGHSVRIGATQDLVEDGAPDAAIMRDAGWSTPRMVGMYSRGAKARHGAMASRLGRVGSALRVATASGEGGPWTEPTTSNDSMQHSGDTPQLKEVDAAPARTAN